MNSFGKLTFNFSIYALMAGLLTPTFRSAAIAAKAERPNIIIMMADDMGFSDIGCYGGEIQTPNLNRLAAGGVRFTQFYNTARCCPTRASLMTGLYPHQAGVGHMMNDRGLDGYRGNLNKNCVTIAEALKRGGYATYMSGKWHVTRHVAPNGPKFNWPRQRGFDRFFGTIHGAGSFYDPNSLTLDNTQIPPGEDFYYTDAISDHAVGFIKDHEARKQGNPFFLYVAFTSPHWPMHAKSADIAKYNGRYDSGWEALRLDRHKRMIEMGLVDAKWPLSPRDRKSPSWENAELKDWEARLMEVYAAMIDCMDQGIGRIVQSLRDTEQLDHTLILFLADNGGCAEGMGRGQEFTPRPESPVQPMSADALQRDMIPKFTRDGYPVRQGKQVMAGPADTYLGYGLPWANASNTPFREYKHWVHEGGISSPLIAHWPKGIEPSRHGEFEGQPAHLIDLMATCVDVSGVEYPREYKGETIQPYEGVSLLSAFNGRSLERPQPIYWEHEGNRALRDGKWKLVAKGPAGPWELYDIDADRTELKNLADRFPDRLKSLVSQWEAWAKRAKVLPWIWNSPYGQTESLIGSPESRFELKQGDQLRRSEAPRITDRAFVIEAEIREFSRDGVIVAQGGSSEGFALYLKDGRLTFATRREGHLISVASDEPLSDAPKTVVARLSANGVVTLSANNRRLARSDAFSKLSHMPSDGLQVGSDLDGAVGEYTAPFEFQGRLGAVTLTLRK